VFVPLAAVAEHRPVQKGHFKICTSSGEMGREVLEE